MHPTYAPNITDLKGIRDSNIIIVGDSKPYSHQWIDHPDRKSVRKQWP